MTCPMKIRFTTEQEAENHRLAHEANRHVDKGELNTYRCPRCGGFHNGHVEPRSRKAEIGYLAEVVHPDKRVKFTIGDVVLFKMAERERAA